MHDRLIGFEHDGHRFEAVEHVSKGARLEPVMHWHVRMDGDTVLEFAGEYPYRDEDVQKRVLEWYGIQKSG